MPRALSFVLSFAAALLVAAPASVHAGPFKNLRHAIKDGARDVGHAVKDGAKAGGRATKSAFKGGGAGTRSGVKAGGRKHAGGGGKHHGRRYRRR